MPTPMSRSQRAGDGGPIPPRITAETLAQGTQALTERDDAMRAIVDRFGPPPLWVRAPGFDTLVRIILEQQVSLASAKAVYARVCGTSGSRPLSARAVREAGTDGLRASGVTRQKATYIHDLAGRIIAGDLRLGALTSLPMDDARTALLALRGVGPWTADVYCLVALRAADVWPVGDVALADATHRVLGLRARPSQDRLTRLARRWAPWRSVAARLLWHHYLSSRRAMA